MPRKVVKKPEGGRGEGATIKRATGIAGPTPDYDMEGYRKKYGNAEPGRHLTDEFKLPSHITFSDESIYHNEKTPGGQWRQERSGKWHYTPSDYVLQQHGPEKMKEYFKDYEPDAVLHLPEETSRFKETQRLKEAGPGEE